jgi:hypothetical protein
MDAADSKKPGEKHFAPRHGPAQLRHALWNEKPEINTYVKFFLYEDGIKIKNKYFPTIFELHICLIKPSAGLPSLMRLSL